MAQKQKILIAASMRGGAEAVAPIAKRLKELGREVIPLPYAKGMEGFDDYPKFKQRYPVTPQLRVLAGTLSTIKPDVIVTGTQFQSKSLATGDGYLTVEQKLWLLGRDLLHVPTVAVVDAWGNYAERFSDLDVDGQIPLAIRRPLAHLPDRIIVPDVYARTEMAKLGFDLGKLEPTGNPHFESVLGEYKRARSVTMKNLLPKEDWMKMHESFYQRKLVVFLSDSMKDVPDIGFTEESVVRSFMRILDDIAAKTYMQITAIVCAHPVRYADTEQIFRRLWKPSILWYSNIITILHIPGSHRLSIGPRKLQKERDVNCAPLLTEKLVMAADLVAGTYNNPLVTARVIGRPALFYVPGLNPKYDFYRFMGEQGTATWVNTESGLEPALRGLLDGTIVQKAMQNVRGATDAAIRLIDSL